AAYRRVADTGELSAVTILGAAGSGKSALLSDLLADLPSGSGDAPRVLSARAHREGLSYGVFSRLLRARFGVADEMSLEVATSRVRSVAQEVLGHTNVEDVCFFLGQLMGLPFDESPLTLAATDDVKQAEGMRRALVRRFFEADSVRVPLCLIFDDLHFADPDSLE